MRKTRFLVDRGTRNQENRAPPNRKTSSTSRTPTPLSTPSRQTLISRSKRMNSKQRLQILCRDSVLLSQFSILHHRVFLPFQASHNRDCCRIGPPGWNRGGGRGRRGHPALFFFLWREFLPWAIAPRPPPGWLPGFP